MTYPKAVHLANRVIDSAVELRHSRIPGTSTYPLRAVVDFETAVDAYLEDVARPQAPSATPL